MKLDPSYRISDLAKTFSDATRVRIVIMLMQETDGMTTTDICTKLGLLQPRVSSHLSILLKRGFLSVAKRSRERIYTLSSHRKISRLLRDFLALSARNGNSKMRLVPKGATNEVRIESPIRQCRTCYDHLAGLAGVELLESMLRSGWLSETSTEKSPSKVYYRLTQRGEKSLRERGVDIDLAKDSRRKFAYACLDCTERHPHLGGSLGSAILNSFFSRGMVERNGRTRALSLLKPVSSWLNMNSRVHSRILTSGTRRANLG